MRFEPGLCYVFIRVLDSEEYIGYLPVINSPPQQGRRRVVLAAYNPLPFPGRQERHLRRQGEIDAQCKIIGFGMQLSNERTKLHRQEKKIK